MRFFKAVVQALIPFSAGFAAGKIVSSTLADGLGAVVENDKDEQ